MKYAIYWQGLTIAQQPKQRAMTSFDISTRDGENHGVDRSEPGARKRILVVESEHAAADELIRILEAEGHTVENAANAATALLHLQQFNPQLVLLGTYLSDMPGYELTAILRGAPQYGAQFRHVGLLFVADRHKLLKHRFIGAPEIPIAQYIFKPIDAEEVRGKVAREIEKRNQITLA